MRTHLRIYVILLAVVGTLVGTAGLAAAHSHTITSREPVFGQLVHEEFRVPLGGGAVARGNILRFPEGAEHLELRSSLARGTVAGIEPTRDIARRERANNALAGTNGGYWLPRPTGAPNGFAVQNGVLIGARSQLGGGGQLARGVVGIRSSGRLLMDWMHASEVTLQRPDGSTVAVDEVNIQPFRTSGLIVYDQLFGTPINAPAGSTVIVVASDRLRPMGTVSGSVSSVTVLASDTGIRVDPGTNVIVAHGNATQRVAGISPGQTVSVSTTPTPGGGRSPTPWGDTISAVPGGPLLVRNGHTTSSAMWESEAFSHIWSRHPRTAIGRTAAGEVLLVTVDGRRSGWSDGMTIRELQQFMVGLKAHDALNLDGGGSTTMTVDGQITNRPSESGRSVANALLVHHSYPFDATNRLAGSDRYATAARISRSSHSTGATDVVIATGRSFPDALAGGPIAAALDAPLLLTDRDSLPPATVEALGRLQPERAWLLGGTAAVTNRVRDQLRDLGIPTVRRLEGADRYATAATVARAMVAAADVDRVFLSTGRNFPDALSASSPAGMLGAPILLTDRNELHPEARAFLEERGVREVVIVGGTTVISRAVAEQVEQLGISVVRRGGADRYDTARRLNEWAQTRVPGLSTSRLLVANGNGFADALAGGPLGAKRGSLLMIVPPKDVHANPHSSAYLSDRGPDLDVITLLGGRAVITLHQQWQLDQIALR